MSRSARGTVHSRRRSSSRQPASFETTNECSRSAFRRSMRCCPIRGWYKAASSSSRSKAPAVPPHLLPCVPAGPPSESVRNAGAHLSIRVPACSHLASCDSESSSSGYSFCVQASTRSSASPSGSRKQKPSRFWSSICAALSVICGCPASAGRERSGVWRSPSSSWRPASC